jgi:hypothetical protein
LHGTSNAVAPIEIQIGRISADGTFTSGSSMPDEEELSDTFQTNVGINASAEPTFSDFLRTLTVHPQSGLEYLAPLGQEITINGGGMLGFVATASFGVNVGGYVMFDRN